MHSYRAVLGMAIISVALMSSCQGQINEEAIVYEIDPVNFSSWVRLYKIEDITELENKDGYPLSNAYKCLVSNDRVVYWDYKGKNVSLFDRNGTFIHSVGSRGKASSEYIDIHSIAFNEDKSIIKVLDERGIINYSAKDGSYISRECQDLDDVALIEKFYPIGNDYLLFSSQRENCITLYHEGKERGLRQKEGFVMSTEHFYGYKDTVRVISDYGDFFIDSYYNGNLQKRFVFDLAGRELPRENKPKSFAEFGKIDSDPLYFKSIVSAYETENYLYLSVVGYKRDAYDCFINKNTRKVYAGPSDKKSGICIMDCDEKYFYALIYSDSVEKDSFMYPILKDKIQNDEETVFLIKFVINENL